MDLAPLALLHLLHIPPEKRRRRMRRRMKVRWRLVPEEEEEGEPATEKTNEREGDVERHVGVPVRLFPRLLPTPSLFHDPCPALARGTAAVCFDGGSVEPGGGDDGERKTRTRMRSVRSGAEGPGRGRKRKWKIQSGWDLGVGEHAGGVVRLHDSSARTDNPASDMPRRECLLMPGC